MSKIEVLTPAEAGAALEEIASRTALLSGALAEIGTKLQKAEADLGEAILSGDEDAVRGVADLRLRADGLSAGLAALEKRREAALVGQQWAIAVDLRRQARVKRGELAKLEKQTGELLDQLSKLEGLQFSPGILSSQIFGAWYAPGLNKPESWHAGYRDVVPDPTNMEPWSLPKSRGLRKAISDLEAQAVAIEQKLVTPEPAAVQQVPAPENNFSDASYRNPGPRSEWGQ
jgi:hypothetical protein